MDEYWQKLAYERRDVSECKDEPIQFCGAIQSWGFFVACKAGTDEIIAVSENFAQLNGLTSAKMLGHHFAEFATFEDDSHFTAFQAIERAQSGLLRLKLKNNHETVIGHFTLSATVVMIDIERDSHRPEQNSHVFVEHLRKLVFQIDRESDMIKMLERAAQQIRALTHFDRVMVYRFEQSCDGNVVAESHAEGLEPYLGLWYPASDIPPQARALYLNSKYRMIVDTQALPVQVATKVGLGRSELDLSGSALRAVSPFHIEYLQNMGVRASFSIPLKVNGKLWGLIACHTYDKPHHLSRELRSNCELAGQVLSGRLSDQLNERRLRTRNQILSLSQLILARVADGRTPIEAFLEIGPQLLEMTNSTGVFVRFGGETTSTGEVPPLPFIDQVIDKLRSKDSLSLWSSEEVAADLNIAAHPRAIGAMAVPFSFGFDDLIIWFRPESIREVIWGGNPNSPGNMADQLSPRTSFKAWSQIVKNRSREWNEIAQEAAQHLLFMFVKGIFQKASELSRANLELERLTQAKDEFIGMISHELRTPLGVMIGWIDILRDEGSSDPRVNQALEIIDRNAKLQVNLINDLLDVSRIIAGKMRLTPQDGVAVGEIIADVAKDLQHSASAKSLTLVIDTPEPVLASVDPDRVRQIIWNLLSNSIKFTPRGGRITLKLARVASSYEISVSDTGIGIEPGQLKRIFDRFAQSSDGHASLGGLGLGLSIVRALVELHGGHISATSAGKDLGSTFTASFPISNIKAEASSPSVAEAPATKKIVGELVGVRVLLAEDQSDAGLALDYYLRKAGAETVLVKDGAAAFQQISENHFDILLSDVGMPIMDGIELIKKVRKLELDRRVDILPAVALTAYATPKDRVRCLEAGFQNHIAKPVDRDELLAVMRSVLVKR